jgi:hypothetical protein
MRACVRAPRVARSIVVIDLQMVGLTGNRNADDEAVIRAIADTNPHGNPMCTETADRVAVSAHAET